MFRNRLRDLRQDHDLSQEQVGEILHVKQATYSGYELGAHEMSIEAWIRLAEFYEVNLDYLVGRTDEREMLPKSKLWRGME